jgi:hypothetical protein
MSNIEHRFAAKLRGNQSIPVPGTATTDSNVASPERLTAIERRARLISPNKLNSMASLGRT